MCADSDLRWIGFGENGSNVFPNTKTWQPLSFTPEVPVAALTFPFYFSNRLHYDRTNKTRIFATPTDTISLAHKPDDNSVIHHKFIDSTERFEGTAFVLHSMTNLNQLKAILNQFWFQLKIYTSFKSSNFHEYTHSCDLLLCLFYEKSRSIGNVVFALASAVGVPHAVCWLSVHAVSYACNVQIAIILFLSIACRITMQKPKQIQISRKSE